MKADPVRLLAHEILIAVEEGGALDAELARALDGMADARGRSFLAELVRGTLQWQGRYDRIIARFARRNPPTDAPTLCLLRLSLHQMLALDGVPAYAAIHQAGELCRHRPGVRKVPFVNGLLQAVRREVLGAGDAPASDGAAREEKLRALCLDPAGDAAAGLAAWQSHPLWLVRRWIARYGWERTEAVCTWNNQPVPLVFHVLSPCDPADAVRQLDAAGCPTTVGAGPRTLVAGQRMARAQLEEILAKFPWLIVQDATVQEAVAWLAGEPGLDLGNESPVLDMCAAPGGKTAYLAACWPGRGRIVAMDHRLDRVRLLAEGVKRIEADRVDVLLADGARPPFRPATFGAVLLDGPCSGTGVLRHHPEGRWRLKSSVPARKGAVLVKLAAAAADLLLPGGLLMYATCSLEPQENDEVVEALLRKRPDLEPAPPACGRWKRTWLPGEAPGDGFFAARMRKKG